MATRKNKKAKTARKAASSRSARSGRRVAEMTTEPSQIKPEMSRAEAHAIADRIIGVEPRGQSGPEREAPRDVEMWATREMGYDGQQLERGQVFRLKGLRNDKLLSAMDYCLPIETPERYPCRVCGAVFMDPWQLEGHGKHRHEQKRVGPPPPMRMDDESQVSFEARFDQWALSSGDAADAETMRRDTLADEVHPLNLENTAASRA